MSLEHMVAVRKIPMVDANGKPLRGPHAIDPVDKYILLMFAWHANHEDLAWPSFPTIASYTGFHRDTVKRAVERLCESGHMILRDVQWQGRSNRYYIPPVDDVRLHEPTADSTRYASANYTDPPHSEGGTDTDPPHTAGGNPPHTAGGTEGDPPHTPRAAPAPVQGQPAVQDRGEFTMIQEFSEQPPSRQWEADPAKRKAIAAAHLASIRGTT